MPQTDRPSMPSGSAPNVAGTFSTAKLTASEAAIDMESGNPGKTEFPANWNDEKIMSKVLLDVARDLIVPPRLQQRNNRWVCTGTRDGVEVVSGNTSMGAAEKCGPLGLKRAAQGW